MKEKKLIPKISFVTIFCLFSIVLNSCCHFTVVGQGENLEQYIRTYWAKDSLSRNGFRDLAAIEIKRNKKKFIGKDPEYMIGLLGQPKDKSEHENKIIYFYRVLDIRYGGNTLVIIFDQSTQKVVNINLYNDEG